MKQRAGTDLYLAAASFSRALTRIAEEEFAPSALSPSYAFLLLAIEEQAGSQPSLLAQEMDLAASTVTRLLDKLETRGLIRRKTTGKASQVFLTPAARKLLPGVHKCKAALAKRVQSLLGRNAAELTEQMVQGRMALWPDPES